MASRISKDNAIDIVREYLQSDTASEAQIEYGWNETAEYWIIQRARIDRQPLIGNKPILVSKENGQVLIVDSVYLEFVRLAELSFFEKLRRWYNRRFVYGGKAWHGTPEE